MKIINKIKSIVWESLCAIGQARYAAELARNGKWQEAQNLYRN